LTLFQFLNEKQQQQQQQKTENDKLDSKMINILKENINNFNSINYMF
jgi:hypothetical protein